MCIFDILIWRTQTGFFKDIKKNKSFGVTGTVWTFFGILNASGHRRPSRNFCLSYEYQDCAYDTGCLRETSWPFQAEPSLSFLGNLLQIQSCWLALVLALVLHLIASQTGLSTALTKCSWLALVLHLIASQGKALQYKHSTQKHCHVKFSLLMTGDS